MTDPRESEELKAKERRDAKRKAESRGLPLYILRGRVYRCDAGDDSVSVRQAEYFEQLLWDALPDLG